LSEVAVVMYCTSDACLHPTLRAKERYIMLM